MLGPQFRLAQEMETVLNVDEVGFTLFQSPSVAGARGSNEGASPGGPETLT